MSHPIVDITLAVTKFTFEGLVETVDVVAPVTVKNYVKGVLQANNITIESVEAWMDENPTLAFAALGATMTATLFVPGVAAETVKDGIAVAVLKYAPSLGQVGAKVFAGIASDFAVSAIALKSFNVFNDYINGLDGLTTSSNSAYFSGNALYLGNNNLPTIVTNTQYGAVTFSGGGDQKFINNQDRTTAISLHDTHVYTVPSGFSAIENGDQLLLIPDSLVQYYDPFTGLVVPPTGGPIDFNVGGFNYSPDKNFVDFKVSQNGITTINTYDMGAGFNLVQTKDITSSGYSVSNIMSSGSAIKETTHVYDNDNNLIRDVIVRQDNSLAVNTYGLFGGAMRQDIYNTAGQPTGAVIYRPDGSRTNINFSSGGNVLASRTDVSSSGSVEEVTTYMKDGSYFVKDASGNIEYHSSGAQQALSKSVGGMSNDYSGPTFSDYVSGVATTLATQFSQLMFSDNLPAALAVSAFSSTAIRTALGTSNSYVYVDANGTPIHKSDGSQIYVNDAQAFAINFGVAVAGAVGGIAGAQIGREIFDAIGLPQGIGSTIGGLVGSAGTQYLAQEVVESMGFQLAGGGADFWGGLGNGGLSSAGSLLGNELSSLVIGDGGIESQIGGTVGSTIASLAIGSSLNFVFPGAGFFLGGFVGNFLGSIFGSFFGGVPSVGPNAVAQIGYYTNGINRQYAVAGSTADNGGDTQIAVSIASAAVDRLNIILQAIGGTVDINQMVVNTSFIGINGNDYTNVQSVGYFQNQYFYTPGSNYPQDYPNKFSSAEADAGYLIMRTLRTTPIVGGNEYMKLAIQRSNATNVSDFISDINAASDYSIYVLDPLAFDVAMAASGSELAWQKWNEELVRIQAMGLDAYSHGTLVAAAPILQLTSAMRSVVVNGNVAGNELITPAAGSTFNIILAAGLSTSSYWFSRSGNNLVMNFFGSGHTTTIQNWFAGNSDLMQSIVLSDGTAIGSDMIDAAIAQDATIVTIVQAALTPQIATLMDAGIDVFATGLQSRVIQTADGHVGFIQYNSNNGLVARQWFTEYGDVAQLDAGSYVVGAGQSSAGNGNFVIIRNSLGLYQRWDIADGGAVTKHGYASSYQVSNAVIHALNMSYFGAALNVDGNGNTIFIHSGAAVNVTGGTKFFGDEYKNIITGGSGNDWLYASGGGDQRYGGAGDDIFVYAGTDTITDGGAGGTDWLAVQQGTATINLANADQSSGDTAVVTGFENVDGLGNASVLNFTGSGAANFVRGGVAADTLVGGGGDDTVYYDTSDISTDGGTGNDTLIVNDIDSRAYKADVALTINLGNASDQVAGGGTTTGFENVNGGWSTAALTITGDAGVNILRGGSGSDSIDGAGGTDSLYGGDGTDYIYYDAADSIANAGTGVDILMLRAGTSSQTINLADTSNQVVGTNVVTGFEYVHAVDMTAGVIVSGDANNNTFNMGSGNDTLDGAAGVDVLYGNGGDDRITYDAADNAADGGTGNDTLVVNRTTALTIDLRNVDQVAGDVGSTANFENVDGTGSTGALTIIGSIVNSNLRGGSGVDVISDAGGDDIIDGGSGADSLYGNNGNDKIIYDSLDVRADGGAGVDTLVVNQSVSATINLANASDQSTGDAAIISGFENVDGTGSTAAITMFGDAGSNVLRGGSGNDWLYASGGGDLRYGGGGGDIVIYNGSDSITDGGTGIDWLAVQSGVATINLGNTADQSTGDTAVVTGFENVDGLGNSSVLNLTGDSGANFVRGGIAADALAGGGGDDAMSYDASDISTDGGAGNDILYVNDASSRNYKPDVLVTANLANAADQITSGGITTGFENVDGSASTVALNLTGDAGSNILKGGNANDVLDGGAGADSLYGGAGSDTILYDAADIVADAGSGVDILFLRGSVPTAISLAAANQIVGATTVVTGFEYVHGVEMTSGIMVTGDVNNNVLNMGSGNDVIDGGAGIDSLYGNAGDDRIVYDAADSEAQGGAGGSDTLVISGSLAVAVDLRNTDQVTGGGLTSGFENVDASGSTAALTLYGDTGANVLRGGSGNDVLATNIGNDTIYGGAGNDIIYGNVGDDIVYGGSGNDTYNFIRGDGADTIFENDATVGNIDYLKFASGINYDQLWFKQVGNSLEVDVIGTSDKVTIDNWFLGTARQTESIQAGGKEIYNSSVINLVNAMAGLTAPPAGQTTLTAAQHTALDPVIAANWHAA